MAEENEDEQDDLHTFIRHQVWGGFADPSEIAEAVIEDYLDPNDSARYPLARVLSMVLSEWKAKARAELSWPERTDWDRLDEAFDELFEHDILALHCAGVTQSDGWGDVLEVGDEIEREEGLTVKGGCFYHQQDVDVAVDGHGLYLTFGGIAERMEAVAVGELVASEVRRQGLKVTWDGQEGSRIHVAMDWKKRYEPEDDEDED